MAAQYRGVLQGAAADFGVELKDWQGTLVPVTDANKADVLRRACEDELVRLRFAAFEHLHRGFLAGGGGLVLRAMDAEGVPTLRPLVYDPGVRARRRAAVEEVMTPAQRAANNIKLCPHCGVPTQKIDGCDVMTCGRDAHGMRRAEGGCGRGFSWRDARH
jgi:hypothetical protein